MPVRKKPLDERDSQQLRAVGRIIRDSRRGRLSLESLAARAGISAGQLSQIENGTGNPTVEMLIRIAGALDLTVTDLLDRQPAGQTYVVRADQRRHYRVLGTGQDVTLLTPGIRHEFTVSHGVIQPGEVRPSPQFQGDSLFYVLSGELEVRKPNVSYRLRQHDSLVVTHPFETAAASTVPVEFLGVFRPEGA